MIQPLALNHTSSVGRDVGKSDSRNPHPSHARSANIQQKISRIDAGEIGEEIDGGQVGITQASVVPVSWS
jgi:hypothetical protein